MIKIFKKKSFLLALMLILPTLLLGTKSKADSNAFSEEKLIAVAEDFIFNTISEEAYGDFKVDHIDENEKDFVEYCRLRFEYNKLSHIPVDSREMDLELADIKFDGKYIDTHFKAAERVIYTGYDVTSKMWYDYYIRFIEIDGEYKIVKANDGGNFERDIPEYRDKILPEKSEELQTKMSVQDESNKLSTYINEIDYSFNDMIKARLDECIMMENMSGDLSERKDADDYYLELQAYNLNRSSKNFSFSNWSKSARSMLAMYIKGQ